MLSVIGAGLSRTGTLSLHQALVTLGYESLHFDLKRLQDVLDGASAHPNFRRYDDVDAVTDLPTAFFYRELAEAYPDSKIILTIRDVDDWWQSLLGHFEFYYVAEESRIKHKIGRRLGIRSLQEDPYHVVRRHLRNMVYGSPTPKEFLYKKRFNDHNASVIATIPPDRLLVMDIAGGEGWSKLCAFLDRPFPNVPFPHAHKSELGEPAGRVGR